MPALANKRHERFAQLCAQGWTGRDAYMSVFETDNPKTASANASRLRARPEVQGRIVELEGEHQRGAIEAAGVDRQYVLENLVSNLARSVKANNLPAANRALELIGRATGCFIERFQFEQSTILDGKSPEEIQAFLRSMIHDLGMLPRDFTDDELRAFTLRKKEKLATLGIEVREVEPQQPGDAQPGEAPTRPH